MPSNMILRSASARSIRASRRETQARRNLQIYEVRKAERRLRQCERQEDILSERLRLLLEEVGDDDDDDLERNLERNRRRLAELRRAQWILQQELLALMEENAASAA